MTLQPSLPGASSESMDFGEIQPSQSIYDAWVERVQEVVRERASYLRTEDDRHIYLENFTPLDFISYCSIVKQSSQHRNGRNYGAHNLDLPIGSSKLLSMGPRKEFTQDLEGWINYLGSIDKGYERRLSEIYVSQSLPSSGRDEHTLIAAKPKWGKSELLKQLVHHYVRHDNAGVLLIDPHNDAAEQIAHWPELVNSGRLIYLDPALVPGRTFGLNPLDGSGLDLNGRRLVAAQWANILSELTTDISNNMTRILRACVHVLLAMPGGATFWDLMLLLGPQARPEPKSRGRSESLDAMVTELPQDKADKQRAAELLAFARSYAEDRLTASFFRTDFELDQLSQARTALRSRLETILNLPHAYAMLVGHPTINLREALDAKKVVIANLSAFDKEGAAMIGKLLIALVYGIGRKRANLPQENRVPVHVFIDEATTMVTPTVLDTLRELRKFRVHLTLAQQVPGDGFTPAEARALRTCTGCKFIAPTGETMVDLLELPGRPSSYPEIRRHEFWVKWPDIEEPLRVKVHGNLADKRLRVTDGEWDRFVHGPLAKYYRDEEESPRQQPNVAVSPGTSPEDQPDPLAGFYSAPAEPEPPPPVIEVPSTPPETHPDRNPIAEEKTAAPKRVRATKATKATASAPPKPPKKAKEPLAPKNFPKTARELE